MKLNPYEQGQTDSKNGVRNSNPFPVFTQRWALYNRGFNSVAYEKLGPTSETPQDSGRMQGRGAA